MCVGGSTVSALAAELGGTPYYAYDKTLIRGRIRDLRRTLPHTLQLHYAIKANPYPPLIALMAELVDGLDVASAGEMALALANGVAPARISFAGPGKRPAELEAAVAAGVLLNVESFREVRLLASISKRLQRPARVAVRINPGFELKSAGMKMGGGPKPFGVDSEQVPALLQEIATHDLGFEGFHIYAGSQNLQGTAIAEMQQQSYALICELARFAPNPVRGINLGGGFGIPYFTGDDPLDLAPVALAMTDICQDATQRFPQAHSLPRTGSVSGGVRLASTLPRSLTEKFLADKCFW